VGVDGVSVAAGHTRTGHCLMLVRSFTHMIPCYHRSKVLSHESSVTHGRLAVCTEPDRVGLRWSCEVVRQGKQLPVAPPSSLHQASCHPSILLQYQRPRPPSFHPDIIHIYQSAHQYQSICKPARPLVVASPWRTTLCVPASTPPASKTFTCLIASFPLCSSLQSA
jgi:hypothetical protein